MNQSPQQSSSRSENVGSEVGIASLNPGNVDFMQRFAEQTGIAAADDS
jgi:hypothetical protein